MDSAPPPQRDPRDRTGKAILSTGLATVAGSAPGLLLPLLIAHYITYRPETDAYFLAVDTTLFAATIFALVLKTVVVPFVIEWDIAGSSPLARRMVARISLQALLGATTVYLLTAAVVVIAVLPLSSFDSAQRAAVETYLVYLLPLPGAMAWASVLGGAHYAKARWAFTSWSEGFRGAAPLLTIVFVAPDLTLAAAALSLGELARIAFLQVSWSRLAPRGADRRSRGTSTRFWRVTTPQLLSMVVVNTNPFIDRLFSSSLRPGSLTTLLLAEKLYFVPQLLLSTAVATVYGTRWARDAVSESKDRQSLFTDAKAAQVRLIGAALLVSVASALATIVLAEPLARFLTVDADDFAATLIAFVFGLPAALSAALSLRLFLAVKQTRILIPFAVIVVALNAVGDYFGALLLGVAGIALSSSLVRTAGALLYWYSTPRVLGLNHSKTSSADKPAKGGQ